MLSVSNVAKKASDLCGSRLIQAAKEASFE